MLEDDFDFGIPLPDAVRNSNLTAIIHHKRLFGLSSDDKKDIMKHAIIHDHPLIVEFCLNEGIDPLALHGKDTWLDLAIITQRMEIIKHMFESLRTRLRDGLELDYKKLCLLSLARLHSDTTAFLLDHSGIEAFDIQTELYLTFNRRSNKPLPKHQKITSNPFPKRNSTLDRVKSDQKPSINDHKASSTFLDDMSMGRDIHDHLAVARMVQYSARPINLIGCTFQGEAIKEKHLNKWRLKRSDVLLSENEIGRIHSNTRKERIRKRLTQIKSTRPWVEREGRIFFQNFAEAVAKNDEKTISEHLRNATNPNISHYKGLTPLEWAAKNQREDHFFRILNFHTVQTPILFRAICFWQNYPHLNDILPKLQAVRFTKDIHGNTILHYLAPLAGCQLLRYFLEAGMDVNAQNKDGNTPMHLADEKNLLVLGEFKGDYEKQNNTGFSVLDRVLSLSLHDNTPQSYMHDPTIHPLVQHGMLAKKQAQEK